ncbi:hypothetical protein ACQKP5_27870, partial [Pseudomonas vancouverensis]|uniref:hypothetical protein n=1 Tax=Pseudomonas vancouverensis TaxID=95300 RepID=UPI003D00ED74
SLAVVQALRLSGQTLNEVFTYTVSDIFGASNYGATQPLASTFLNNFPRPSKGLEKGWPMARRRQ